MKSILIVRFSSLGDVLLTTPLIRVLRKKYPEAIIDFVVKPDYAALLESSPHINHLLFFTVKDATALKKRLKKSSYQMVIDLQNNLRSKKLTSGLTNNLHRFSKHSLAKWLLVNFKINLLKNLPPIPERYIATVRGLQPDQGGLEFYPSGKSVAFSEGKNFIAVCPGSKHFTKMWGVERFKELCTIMVQHQFIPVLLGGIDDAQICDEIAKTIPEALNLSGVNNIHAMAAVMKNCKAAVCNDSGLMHLACALKIPVLVFFGSTVQEFGFVPYKNKSVIMENTTLTCRPCSHIGRASCPKGHFKCMTELKPSDAFIQLQKLVEG